MPFAVFHIEMRDAKTRKEYGSYPMNVCKMLHLIKKVENDNSQPVRP
jgi:hypothetical protein